MTSIWPFRRRAARLAPSVPAGARVYAVGDVHGRDDLLEALLGQISADLAARPAGRAFIVFLGDLIDRGPASAAVVERLSRLDLPGARPVFLAGNHEEVLLRILDGQYGLVSDWLRFGGAQCLASYGVEPARLQRVSARRAAEVVREAIPPAHVAFLRGFGDSFRLGDYLFVHAGIRPGTPLEHQKQSDLRWIRREFLQHDGDHGFVVVHGHTIAEEVELRANRIGLDTGAYASGTLSAIVLEGEEQRVLQARVRSEPDPHRVGQ